MCMKISRCILTFNVLSFLSATVLLVVSILRLVNGTTEVENDNLVDDCVRKLVHEAILIPIIISIGCAVAVMLTSFLGCYSSSAKSILGIIFVSFCDVWILSSMLVSKKALASLWWYACSCLCCCFVGGIYLYLFSGSYRFLLFFL